LLAHARRKFDEAKSTSPPEATAMLDLIQLLYKTEAAGRPAIQAAESLSLSLRSEALQASYRQRAELRQKFSAPIMRQIEAWLLAHQADALPESPLGKAITYMRNQWKALSYFLSDGAAEIDNNIAENAVRPLAIGRKNWLFLGSDQGGRRLAILYTLVESYHRNNVNPWHYLKDVLVRISHQPPGQLLPHHWR